MTSRGPLGQTWKAAAGAALLLAAVDIAAGGCAALGGGYQAPGACVYGDQSGTHGGVWLLTIAPSDGRPFPQDAKFAVTVGDRVSRRTIRASRGVFSVCFSRRDLTRDLTFTAEVRAGAFGPILYATRAPQPRITDGSPPRMTRIMVYPVR